MKPARIFFTNGAAGVAENQFVRHEGVAELHAIGAGAIHREERLARLQRHGRVGAIRQEHHDLPRRILALEDRAEVMVGTEVRDPGQRAAHDITALDLAPLQLQPLDAEEALHRVREARATEDLAAGETAGEFRHEFRIVGIRGVPDQRVLAPRHEGRRAADFADRSDRLNGAAQVGCAILRHVTAPGADLAEAAEQRIRVDLAAVDRGGEWREVFSRDRRNVIGNRPWRLIGNFETRYR